MRREGYIIEEIIDYSNMSESFDEVLRGKKRKRSRQGRYLLAHREEVIKELTEQIANGSFRVSGYRERTIHEYGKERNLQILSMKLTGKTMRSFKDLNVSYKPVDGKKRFPGSVVSIRELVNLPIIVKDFELGIKTEQGEDRCIVSIEQNGEAKKFFTNSEEMKNILQQISELPDGLPFETTIRTETFGKGRTKYVFS